MFTFHMKGFTWPLGQMLDIPVYICMYTVVKKKKVQWCRILVGAWTDMLFIFTSFLLLSGNVPFRRFGTDMNGGEWGRTVQGVETCCQTAAGSDLSTESLTQWLWSSETTPSHSQPQHWISMSDCCHMWHGAPLCQWQWSTTAVHRSHPTSITARRFKRRVPALKWNYVAPQWNTVGLTVQQTHWSEKQMIWECPGQRLFLYLLRHAEARARCCIKLYNKWSRALWTGWPHRPGRVTIGGSHVAAIRWPHPLQDMWEIPHSSETH